MRKIPQFHNNFIPVGQGNDIPGYKAVTLEPGLTWIDVYISMFEEGVVCCTFDPDQDRYEDASS